MEPIQTWTDLRRMGLQGETRTHPVAEGHLLPNSKLCAKPTVRHECVPVLLRNLGIGNRNKITGLLWLCHFSLLVSVVILQNIAFVKGKQKFPASLVFFASLGFRASPGGLLGIVLNLDFRFRIADFSNLSLS